jgi:UDP-N-acetylglucosamine--N-acetylmuramyl-(pentapeptide) pyrophosphoryl-undecaprenol N-acetylglucosamine transferase
VSGDLGEAPAGRGALILEGRPLRVVVAGGGTGGHLYPGIAVVRELMARGPVAVSFAGTARGIEARVLPREGFELDTIRSGGLKGKSLVARLKGALLLPLSAIDAWRLLTRRRPNLVVGVGGYSSGPVVALAALRGIPTLLLEQNAVPGLTNRLLAPWVRAAAVTYERTLPFFRGKGFVAGNPVRPEFLAAPRADHVSASGGGALRVLIFGGSQGAHAINVAAVEAAPKLAASPVPLALVHQTGERDLAMVQEGYQRAGLGGRVEPFLFEMEREMSAADLIVCRAGATTLAEVTAAGKPSILIPLPTATDDHQRRNADVLRQAGAAEVIDQRELSGNRLAVRILALAADADGRARMGAAARALARPDAARVIADRALALAGV